MMRLLFPIVVLMFGVATAARAQEVDARWAPFVGCWEMVEGAANVCVVQATPGAVTLTTRIEGQSVLEQTIIADGASHAISEAGCNGFQRAEWSRDGRKLFARAGLTCANQPPRTVTGLALKTGDDTWLDAQGIEISGRTTVRIRKYRRVRDDRPRADIFIAPYLGAAGFTVEDVKEANAKVSPAVLEAVLAETRATVHVNARDLIALDDAGVPGNVIDLMVAMAYPERFEVERRAASLDRYPLALPSDWSGYWGLGYPYLYAYPGYDVSDLYYYSPFGYAYSGYYYPGEITVGGQVDTSVGAGDADGRVVNGVGYTRVRTRAAVRAETDGGSSNGSAGAASTSSRGTMTSSGATQSSGDSSSSSGASTAGSGSSGTGSGSSEGGRTAQPR